MCLYMIEFCISLCAIDAEAIILRRCEAVSTRCFAAVAFCQAKRQ